MFARFLAPAALLAGLIAASAAPAQSGPGQWAVMPNAPPQAKRVLSSYQVAELVVPVGTGEPGKTDEARLIKLIQETVAPKSWASKGGPGTIDYFPMTMSLVINQTPDVQEQVAGLLAKLRKEQDVQVALEVRLITISEDCSERIGADFNAKSEKPGDVAPAKFLNDKQVFALMEAAQGDQRTNVMQAPKLTVANGQNACVEAASPGFRMTACPAISADRRFVRLHLAVDLADAAPMAGIDTTLVIPDGGTALLGGLKKVVEGRNEYGPPVISSVPYINRLFKTVGYGRETQNVVLMVTPRIIINEEEEGKECPYCAKPDCTAVCAPPGAPASHTAKALAELLKAYDAACADGDSAEAEKLAKAALALDPTCFHTKGGR